MNSWRPYPLLRLIFPFVAGIVAESSLEVPLAVPIQAVAVLTGLLLVITVVQRFMRGYRLRWFPGLLVNLFLLAAGYVIAGTHRLENGADYLGAEPTGLFLAAVAEPPSVTASGWKVILDLQYRLDSNLRKRSHGKALAYLRTKPGTSRLQYGDHILVRADFREISDNSNPHGFNYQHYLKNRGITHRVFSTPWSWQVIDLKPSNAIRQWAFQVRDKLLCILRNNHVEGREFAVAAALLLGYVDELDPELRNAFAASGAMHILSVSGMHVGIIYLFLEFLLGFMNRSKTGRLVKAILLLLLIWFYAILTGLSPSVLRSAAMLSLPIIGRSLNRSPNMYNILAASAIFILAFDPLILLDTGFQLSYLAVTGIMVLYKPVYDLYVTSTWFPDKVWSVVAVSIAAQIATLPLTLYVFHQFPNYFMLTNIFVVPLSSLIIYTGILVLVIGYVPVVSVLCAKVLVFLVWLLNSVIAGIERLPFSTLNGIYLTSTEMLLLYLFIAVLFLYLTRRQIVFLFMVLIVAILLSAQGLTFRMERLQSSKMVVFNARRAALYMFTAGGRAVLLYHEPTRSGGVSCVPDLSSATAAMQAEGIRAHRAYWLRGQVRQTGIAGNYLPLAVSGNFIRFFGCRVAILDRSIPKGLNRELPVDLLIISGNPKISIADALKIFRPRQIVIDATNTGYRTQKWMAEAAVAGVACHACTENGAYEKEF